MSENLQHKSFEELFAMILKNSKDITIADEINMELQKRINYLWRKD
ncbi:MAG TPA: hypothetical protein VGB37_06245 [Candidatus Lokiarchaeia archaeon]